MLINEVICEDQTNILNDLEEIVVRAKANGKFKIPTNMVLAKLRAIGHSIDITSLMDLLATITSVGSANKKDITLDTAFTPFPTLIQKMTLYQKWRKRKLVRI